MLKSLVFMSFLVLVMILPIKLVFSANLDTKLNRAIKSVKKYKIPETKIDKIVKAIIQVESNGNRLAKGCASEKGLMQVSYRTWIWTCEKILHEDIPWAYGFNSYYNKRVGTAYLTYLINRYGFEQGVRRYNQGKYWRGRKGQRYYSKIMRELKGA